MASNEEIDEMIDKLEEMKDDDRSSSEKELDRLKSKNPKERTVDEKVRIDRLSEAVSERKRDERSAKGWKKLRGPSSWEKK